MQMKLFYATGSSDEIKKLEDDVGRCLQALPSDVEVKHVCSALGKPGRDQPRLPLLSSALCGVLPGYTTLGPRVNFNAG